jgi:hypothetical protein
MTDFERLPSWQGAVRDVKVLERDEQGRFIAIGSGTRIELDLRIDPGRFVPGPVRRLIADGVMRRALDDVKRHLDEV